MTNYRKFNPRTLVMFAIVGCSFFITINNLVAQPYSPSKGKVYNDNIVPTIDITIDPDSLNEILTNVFSDHEFPATFVFNDGISTETVNNVGFRLRGNTSRTAAKKSFKVSFNTFIKGQKFFGLEKLNLNGEHNDPSISRSKVFWETAGRLRIPAARANHIELYINGDYYGVYINVEHMDENFLKSRFENNWGNYYKCLYPADLAYLGSNANNYKLVSGNRRVYDLKTNTSLDDYTDLKDFITALSAGSGATYQYNLERVFNVNGFLRSYAFDVLAGNWDNYAGNMNNYYLYHDIQTDKMNYLPYDVDNTYGIDWLNKDWGNRDIYNWELNSANRQLITKLFAYSDYKDRYSFLMNKMIQGFANINQQGTYIDGVRNLIAPYVLNDPYHNLDYGYTYIDFLNSYTQALGGHVDYGFKPYIATRNATASSQLILNNIAPMFSETRHTPYTPYANDSIFLKSWVEDENPVTGVMLHYKIGTSGVFNDVSMLDNGLNYDDASGDEIFGAGIPPQNTGDTIFYFLDNVDANGNIGREPRLDYNRIIIKPAPQLFINEIMASNASSVADNYGQFDDWFELFNSGTSIDLKRIFITDDFNNPGKWNVGDTAIGQNSFLLLWADDETAQGKNHTNFKLSAAGEQLAITEYTGKGYHFIDSLSFGQQFTDVSIGCYPDGAKPVNILSTVTPNYTNVVTAISLLDNGLDIKVFPNPTTNGINIKGNFNSDITLIMYNQLNQIIYSKELSIINVGASSYLDLSNFKVGVYSLMVITKGGCRTIKIIKL
jgi:spore coat protein CotH